MKYFRLSKETTLYLIDTTVPNSNVPARPAPDTAVQIISAACIIHNFILLQNNDDDYYNIEEIHIEYENLNEYEGIVQEERVFAEMKRQHLVNICTRI